MRTLIIGAVVVVALLVAIVVVVPLVLDINRYHGIVQAQLEKALGRTVSFGQMHLSLTPPTVRMDSVVIGEARQFGRGPFASMDAIDASIQLLPLLSREIQMQKLNLRSPKVQLIRNAQGVWNFSTLGPAHPAQQKPAEGSFVLANLEISNGQVTLVDEQKHFKGVYSNIDFSLHGYAPGRPFDFSVTLHLPGPGAETMALSGIAGPVDQADMLKTPFDGKLQLKEVSLGGIQKVLDVPSLKGMDGMASGNLALKNDKGMLASQGSLELKDGAVGSVKIGYPVSLEYRFTDQLATDRLHIEQAKLLLDKTPLSIAGDVNGGATPATISLHVTAQNASIAEVARLASAFGVAFNPSMTVTGNLSADLRAQGPLSQPALDGNVSGKDIHISGGDLKQPVDVSGIELALTPRDIRSNPFTARSGGTQVAVQFALTNYTGNSPLVDASLRTGNAGIPELLSIARAYGVSAAEGVSGTGNLSLDLRASGPLKNTDAMTFSGNGKVSNATLKTGQITQPLSIRNADLQFSQNAATLNNLSASLAGSNATGNMTVRNFNAPQIQFTLNADQVDVLKLQQAFGTEPQPQKRASFDLIPRAEAQTKPAASPSILEKVTGGGAITAGKLIYDQFLLEQVRSNVAFDHGIIRLAPITAGLYGGQQIGSITVDTRPTPMAVTVSTKLNQVDANKLLSSVSSVKQTLYGLLAGNANASFRAASSADMARTLNGTIALDLQKGKLAHVDLLNELSNVGRFVGGGFKSPSSSGGQPFTDIAQLTGNFNVVNGLAQTNNLKAVLAGATMAAEGTANLATEELNMHVTAVLTKAMSQQAGGTQVGGFMQTALANQQGELVLPILLTGTFSKPRVAPDLQRIAQMKLQNLLPTAGNPGGLVSGILGAIGGKGTATQQGQQQPPQQRGLGGILGAITGQQQQPSQQQTQQQPQQQQTQQQPQQQQQQNPLGDLLNQVLTDRKKKQQQQQQQQQQPPPKE